MLVFGIGGSLGTASARRDQRSAAFARDLGTADVAFAAAVNRAAGALVDPNLGPGGTAAADRRTESGGALSSVAVVGADGVVESAQTPEAGTPAADVLRLGRRVTDDPAIGVTLAIATDAGAVRSSAPATAGGETSVLLVAPRYREGAARRTIEERRAAIDGFVIGVLDVGGIADSAFRPLRGDGRAIDVTDGGQVLFSYRGSGAGDRPGDTQQATIDVGGRPWVVSGWSSGGAGLLPWLIALVAIASGIGVLAIGMGAATTRARDAEVAAANRREFGLVLESGALLQRSLDLADVLPAFAVTLSDEFALGGIALVLADESGQLVELFAMGRRPDMLPAAAHAFANVPDWVGPGEALFVPLHRAGRAIGALWILADDGLSHAQLDAIRAIADLAGSAVANAELFRKEQETARQLRELDQLKNDFIGTVSHELRTPVTAIKGFSAILESSWTDLAEDQRRDLIARISRNSESLGTLLNGLLDFARLERRSMTLEAELLDLSAAVRDVVDQMGSLLDQQEVDVDADRPVMAFTDPHAVERIVSNLLTNAAKFSPPGSHIHVEVRPDGAGAAGRALVCIEDEGPGIPADERGRIFSRFYRGSGDAVVRTRGAGIGLAVVQEFADRLGATVHVDAGRRGGARFTVSFPATDPNVDAPRATDGPADARSSP